SAGLLAVALLTATADVAERPPLASCEAGDVRLELKVDTSARVPAFCITPELTSTFLFDAKVARVELAGRDHFRRVSEGADFFMVIPSEAMRDLEPQRVTIHFADGDAPASTTFLLVVHPARAVRQVDILRHTRPVALYEREAREAQSRALRCEEEKALMRAERGGPGGLRGLRAAGLLNEEFGVAVKRLLGHLQPRERNALHLVSALSSRAGGPRQGRVAIEVDLKNLGTKPWTLAGAMLRGARGEELTPLPEATPMSILPGREPGSVMVEFEATTMQARGMYTLTLWDADGRSVILDNVTFP
ncbi:MAG TPA: DUF2381 family protein, partial [Myxococcaceae bacterium]|nr:DUF2381 family protein [Myxococcaceae bacterium]